MEEPWNETLRLIAVFKLIKALSLVFAGVIALNLTHGDAAANLIRWVAKTGLKSGGRYVDKALSKVANLPPVRFKELGAGSFTYSAFFATEGIGLWLQRRWAEWFTVAITGSLVPLELYELFRHPTAGKAIMLVVNVAVVLYMLWNIWKNRPPLSPARVEPGG